MNNKSKLPKRRKTIIIVSILILLLGVLSTAVYLMVTEKTAKDLYLELEYRNFKKLVNNISEGYREFYNKQQPYFNGKYSSRSELTGKVSSESGIPANFENAGASLEIINRGKLVINSDHSPETGEGVTDYTLLLDSTPFLDGRIISSRDSLKLSVPMLLPDKYLSVDRQGLDALLQRFGIPIKPKRSVKVSDIARDIYFNEKEFTERAEEYGDLVTGLIGEEDVKEGNQVELQVGNEKVKGKEIILSLNEEKTARFFRDISSRLAEDDLLLKFTYSNYLVLVNTLEDTGFFQLVDTLDKTGYMQLNDTINGLINYLEARGDEEAVKDNIKRSIDNVEFPEGLKMVLVANKKGVILSRQLDLTAVLKNSGERFSLRLDSGISSLKYDDPANRSLSIKITRSGAGNLSETQLLNYKADIIPLSEDSDKKGKIEITYLKQKGDVKQFGVEAVLDIEKATDKATQRENTKVDYNFTFTGIDDSAKDILKGAIKASQWENRKFNTRNNTLEFTVNFDMPTMDFEEGILSVKAVTEDKFGVDFNIPEIPEEKIVRLDNITDSELGKLQQEIMFSFGRFYLENRNIIDALFN